MPVHDYNGQGIWSCDEVTRRYLEYARQLHIQPRNLSPIESEHSGSRWINPVMHRVIEGIEEGDPACIEIGIEFIEEDAGQPFGRILKSNTARALRRAALTDAQKERVRRRVLDMLAAGNVPHEYKEYAKLLRRIGFHANRLSSLLEKAPMDNLRVARFGRYFQMCCSPAAAQAKT